MFFPGSRYVGTGTYSVTKPNGTVVSVARPPQPLANPIIGYHRRLEGQRLDLIANNYLSDPTAFWRLCDANDAMVPEALGSRELVGVPKKGSG